VTGFHAPQDQFLPHRLSLVLPPSLSPSLSFSLPFSKSNHSRLNAQIPSSLPRIRKQRFYSIKAISATYFGARATPVGQLSLVKGWGEGGGGEEGRMKAGLFKGSFSLNSKKSHGSSQRARRSARRKFSSCGNEARRQKQEASFCQAPLGLAVAEKKHETRGASLSRGTRH